MTIGERDEPFGDRGRSTFKGEGVPAFASESAGDLRFMLGAQKVRAAIILVIGGLVLLFKLLGTFRASYGAFFGIGFAFLTAVGCHLIHQRRFDERWGFRPHVIWIPTDVLLVTLGVYLTGGAASPFYLWYIATLTSAAFVGTRRTAALVAAGNTGCYLGVLAVMGEIRGLDDTLYLPLLRIVFLHAASLLFVQGAVNLRDKRLLIKRLQEEQALRLEELTRLTKELSLANVQIREADRMKSQFLANMSHELRTPLNAIIGFSEVLMGPAGQDEARRVKFLQNIHASGQHLLAVISDILDLSKIEAGKMEFCSEEFDPRTAIEGVATVMDGMAGGRRIRLELDVSEDLPRIETDPARFKQVLYNLISNAIKFSPEGSTVTISARRLRSGGETLDEDCLRVCVADRGIGISPSDQEVIFHEFRQADSAASRRAGGTGLGLALVKRFVELQGGVVGLESEVEKGSTFSCTLPLRARRATGPPRPTREAPMAGEILAVEDDAVATARPRREELPGRPGEGHEAEAKPAQPLVLFVDDDPIGREVFDAMLGEEGYRLVGAADGPEALARASEMVPDVILLDVMMPGMDGFEVLGRLRADPLLADVPVVLVTALDDSGSRLRGIEAGADDFVTKPIDRLQLRARVRTVTRLNRFRRLLTERAKFQWAVESADDGFLLLDEEGVIVYANPRSRLFLGLAHDAPATSRETFLAAARRLYHCEPEDAWARWPEPQTDAVLYLVRPESAGTPAFWLQVEALPLPSGPGTGCLVRLKDVTEGLVARRQVWAFHSAINHKLRTPLTAVLPALEYLSSEPGALGPDAVASLVRPALRSAQRLASEIGDILGYLEAARRPRAARGFDLGRLPDLVSRIASDLGMAGVTTLVEEDLVDEHITLPEETLELVLSELLENSHKFHPSRTPRVEVIAARSAEGIRLAVRDDGATLSPGELARVFTPYYQAEKQHTGQVAGMGLGLPMAAAIVWSAGGACRVRNRSDGAGIIVEVLLPAAS